MCESSEYVNAVILARSLQKKYSPSVVAEYVSRNFPTLTPDDIEHVLSAAEKTEFMVNKN